MFRSIYFQASTVSPSVVVTEGKFEGKKAPLIEVIGGEADRDTSKDEAEYLSDHDDDPIWKLAATVGSTI